jgi:hypothetical protein
MIAEAVWRLEYYESQVRDGMTCVSFELVSQGKMVSVAVASEGQLTQSMVDQALRAANAHFIKNVVGVSAEQLTKVIPSARVPNQDELDILNQKPN